MVSKKSLTKKERFDSLNINFKKLRQDAPTNFLTIRKRANKSKNANSSNSNMIMDPSLERSLEKLNNLENLSKNDFMGSR